MTIVYTLVFKPLTAWSQYVVDYPFERCASLCDIVNTPGKTGQDALAVIEKQWARKGYYKADAAAGVGDGGGENEGFTGVHALLTTSSDGYTNRRCLGHFGWRITDAGLDEMGQRHQRTKAIAT